MHKQTLSRRLIGPALLLLLLSSLTPAVLGATSVPLDARLLAELAMSPTGKTSFLVFLRDQADLSTAANIQDRTARVEHVYQSLRDEAARSQAGLRADLEAWGVPYHPYFIVNALLVTGDVTLAQRLAARPEVDRIVADPAFDGIDDPPPGPPGPLAVDAIEWNISRVNADDVWNLGYIGQGIVVGSCDSGVDYDHPALVNQYRGNLGGGNFDHDYNWHDSFGEYAIPTDPNGHGTHTTGTMVGSDDPSSPISATNAIGMAPGAQWIACKLNSGGTWKASKYIECWEWFLAPTRVDGTDPRPDLAPHIINNSWTCPGSEGCDPETLRDAARALYAAGIAIAKSGGNTGPNCGTTTNPGQYPELLATASFNSGDVIANSSSRGPVTIDGEIRIKPDIAAPGVGVRSSIPGGGYSSFSGTSMASPHTAGLMALLWSAHPALIGDLETTYQIVKATAEPKIDTQCPPNGPGGRPNNVWGWGVLDALAAVQGAGGLGLLRGTVTDSSTAAPLPDAEIEIVRTDNSLSLLANPGPTGEYSATLIAATYDVTATLYGYLPETVTSVSVSAGATTTLDLALDPAPLWALFGSVTEQGSGAPLRATLTLLGTPVRTATDPNTGSYNTTVAQGRYTLQASSPGYQTEERQVNVQGNLVEDFALQPAATYYLRDSLEPCGPSFSWIDITATGTPRYLGDDSSLYVYLDGRTFPFYGTLQNSLYVGSNGYVTFVAGSNYPGGNTIPSTFPPNNAIYAFWDDLNPANGSQGIVYTELVDDHLYVIEFHQVEHWPNGNPETFEIILDLDSGAITLQYLEVSDTHWTSVGIENSDGTTGLAYTFHDPSYPTATQALAFYPVVGEHPAEQGPGTLNGTVVVSGTGEPIAGATVTAQAVPTGQLYSFPSDPAGFYTGTLCADLYTVTASAPGYVSSAPRRVAVFKDEGTRADFALEPDQPCDPVQGADFVWSPISPTTGETLSFTATVAAGDPPITYTWSLGDDTLLEGQTITHTYAAPGVYTVVLTATNCATATATAVHTVTVACDPVHNADFDWTPVTPTVGQVVTFTGSASGTPLITYGWELEDGVWKTGEVVTHSYDLSGTYRVAMTATNCTTATATTAHTVTVVPSCDPVHSVGLDWTPVTPTVDQVVTFTASALGTQPITYSWKLEDGAWRTGQVVTHSYDLSGTYTITLTATNCLDATAVARRRITIVGGTAGWKVYLPLVLKGYGSP